jgi:hypothetical protein
VVSIPSYISYCDASKLGAGGVWLSGALHLSPIVWHVEWSPDIHANVVSFKNPSGAITNSDLEMAGMLLHFLVLEHVAWCDNSMPIISWMNKLSSARSRVAGRLTRALAMRIHVNKASPLVLVSISGTNNTMVNTASRTFHCHSATTDTFKISDTNFFLLSFSHPLSPSRQPRGASSA